jgi:hypothetical protein
MFIKNPQNKLVSSMGKCQRAGCKKYKGFIFREIEIYLRYKKSQEFTNSLRKQK